jgi:diguanylate cyclase (GGDEF)-like protein/PAS domain S-box-containing protein
VSNKKSSRQLRPLIVVASATALVLLVAIPMAGRVLLQSFATVEANETRQHAEQAARAFDADLRQLAISNRDYAEWDDAESYVRTGAAGFTAANFSKDSLQGMHVDLVRLTRADGTELYSGFLDRSLQDYQSPAPPELLRAVVPYAISTPQLTALAPISRVIRTSAGLMAISVSEIKRSDKTNATGTHMLFGRFLGSAELGRVQETSQLPVRLVPLQNRQAPADAQLPAEIVTWARTSQTPGAIIQHAISDTHIEAYSLLRTIENEPAAIIVTGSNRNVYALGHRMTWALLGSTFGLVSTFLVLLALLIWRLQRSLNAHQSADARYHNIASQMRETIMLVGPHDFRIVDGNSAATTATGYSMQQLGGLTALELFPDLMEELLLNAAAAGAAPVTCQSRLRRADGTFLHFDLSITRLTDDEQDLLCVVGHDISHRKSAEEAQRANQRKLAHHARHDALTGLPNRQFLSSKMPRVLKQSIDSEYLLALIYLDIDHFKSINESRGHGFGDRLLQVVARRLRHSVAMQDVVVRMGGDEFVIVATLLPDVTAVEALATRVQLAIQAPMHIGEDTVAVSTSMGIALHPDNGLDLESLLMHADIALFEAKQAGRRTHRYFVANMNRQVGEEVALEQALRHAVGSRQLYIEYQPVVDLASGKVVSLEALMRWRHPTMGLVPPGKFIPAAEKIGLIASLGQKAVSDVLSQLRIWLDAGVPCVPVAVNVAPSQLARGDLAEIVQRYASEAGVELRWLRLEITESALLQGTEQTIETLQRLRELGCEILIDDFGTGYSSLSYLGRLPVNTLKIDQSFVKQLISGDSHSSIIGAVIDMARKLKLRTVAEGIETPEQLLLLQQMGCDYGQGYLFSRPISARRCRQMLLRHHIRSVGARDQNTVTTSRRFGAIES